MSIPLFHVDAFSDRVFGGNPAAVCPLESWPADEVLQQIAAENNLSETAFFVREADGFRLRWFTPTTEVDLCGHATLAAAWVAFERLGMPGERIDFQTRSGPVAVTRYQDQLELDFPSRPGCPIDPPPALLEGLRATPRETWQSRDVVAVFDSEEEVRALAPDFRRLAEVDALGILATAPASPELQAEGVDFVSRCFFPAAGIDEDPVTGSAHCTLIPYWARRLGIITLTARQISRRGGHLWCELRGDRVCIAGNAALYLEGTIHVDL